MSRIVHLSDLHFGTVEPALLTPLVRAIRTIDPCLVVVSGDLTQRARRDQFRQARSFLDRLPGPVLTVPGNHDVPLDNPVMRFLRPYARYRAYFGHDLEPAWHGPGVSVAGSNSVNPFAWQRGKLPRRRLERLQTKLCTEAGLRIAVMHHPLEHDPGVDKSLMRGAARALAEMGASGIDVVLSGHLHVTLTRPFVATPGLLFVQAGTALSSRKRAGEPNSFNVLDHDGDLLSVTTWATQPDAALPQFTPRRATRWRQDAHTWRSVTDPVSAPVRVLTP